VIAVTEAAIDRDGFKGAFGFDNEPLGAFDPHASDLPGDAFRGVLVEATFETSAIEADYECYILHRQGAVTVLGHEP
jgi:hypothetical protein